MQVKRQSLDVTIHPVLALCCLICCIDAFEKQETCEATRKCIRHMQKSDWGCNPTSLHTVKPWVLQRKHTAWAADISYVF